MRQALRAWVRASRAGDPYPQPTKRPKRRGPDQNRLKLKDEQRIIDGEDLRRNDPMQRKKKYYNKDRMSGQRDEGSDRGTPRQTNRNDRRWA